MWLAKTSSISSKFEILTCKNYIFHGNPIDFETMVEKFPESDDKELRELKENAENANTEKSKTTWVTVWSSWAESKGYNPDIMCYNAQQLDEKLEKFFRRS